MKSNNRTPLFIFVVTLAIIMAVSLLVIDVSVLLIPELESDRQIWLFWAIGLLVVVMSALASIAQLSGYSIKELFVQKNGSVSFTEKQNQINREIMLTRVWDAWIEGVLKKSLSNEVRIELGLELQPDAVENPWDAVLQMPERTPVKIPGNKKILDVFNEVGKSLVIVGKPGSGKTTELLELASQAIEYAKNNPAQPIPVVFNLSTWTPKPSIKDWLVNEFWERYRISPKIGSFWVNNNELFLLLDGLDEVKSEYRNQCVQGINDFIKEQIAPVAICCRRNEFETLATKIKVGGVVFIQPLSSDKALELLQKANLGLVDVFNKIKAVSDSESVNFIHTPLFISILISADKDASLQELDSLVKSTNFQKHLFDFYINQMFKRRGKPIFTKEQTNKCLAWLSSRMVENRLPVFFIENIQSTWLENNKQRKNAKLLKWGLLTLISGLTIGFSLGLSVGSITGLIFGLICGLSFGLFSDLNDIKKPVYKLKWSGITSFLNIEHIFRLVGVLVIGLIFGIVGGVVFGLLCGLIVGLFSELFSWLFGGLNRSEVEIHDKPDQSIRNSFWSFLIFVPGFILSVMLLYWLPVGLIIKLSLLLNVGLSNEPIGVWRIILVVGLYFGLRGGLTFGGDFVISHLVLRWQLYHSNIIPLKFIKLLDFAAERVLLRKVGGGYIFIHGMLMDHFSELDKDI